MYSGNELSPKAIIGLHFTNYKAGWGKPRNSTGFVESIVQNGARPFLNIGMGDYAELRHLFEHHGYRCNKKRVNGNVSIPAVIVIDCEGLAVQQGYDHWLHIQVNERIEPERVLGWFSFDKEMTDEEFGQRVSNLEGRR